MPAPENDREVGRVRADHVGPTWASCRAGRDLDLLAADLLPAPKGFQHCARTRASISFSAFGNGEHNAAAWMLVHQSEIVCGAESRIASSSVATIRVMAQARSTLGFLCSLSSFAEGGPKFSEALQYLFRLCRIDNVVLTEPSNMAVPSQHIVRGFRSPSSGGIIGKIELHLCPDIQDRLHDAASWLPPCPAGYTGSHRRPWHPPEEFHKPWAIARRNSIRS